MSQQGGSAQIQGNVEGTKGFSLQFPPFGRPRHWGKRRNQESRREKATRRLAEYEERRNVNVREHVARLFGFLLENDLDGFVVPKYWPKPQVEGKRASGEVMATRRILFALREVVEKRQCQACWALVQSCYCSKILRVQPGVCTIMSAGKEYSKDSRTATPSPLAEQHVGEGDSASSVLRTHIYLLLHPDEFLRGSNTGHLMARSCPECCKVLLQGVHIVSERETGVAHRVFSLHPAFET